VACEKEVKDEMFQKVLGAKVKISTMRLRLLVSCYKAYAYYKKAKPVSEEIGKAQMY
jgi:hypothetical protein